MLIAGYAHAQNNSEPNSPSPLSKPESLAKRLEILSFAIDIYYEQMISLKSSLALSGLKITSKHSEMVPEDAKSIIDLENTRTEINEAFKHYKADIDTLSEPENIEIYENLKFLYDIVLIKAFLPRFDTIKSGFITRIFTFNTPQFAEEIVPRGDALELFYKNFNLNDDSKAVLNSDFRLSSLIKMHNEITAKLNRNKESNIYQTYPKRIKVKSEAEEAYIYETIIRGENLKPYQEVLDEAPVTAAPPPQPTTVSCSALFAS